MRFAFITCRAISPAILCSVFLGVFSNAVAFASPQQSLVPGGIAIIPLSADFPADSRAHFGEYPVLIDTTTDGERRLIVGIPLAAMPGPAVVRIESGKKSQTVEFTITDKKYTEQHITLPPNDKHVNPGPEELARFAREAKEQQAIYKTFSENGVGWPEFIMPTKGPKTTTFGLKRFFNGEPRAPHLGMDIPAPEGQDAIAPADGVVVQTGDYFFNGRTIMIDHGHGLISMLCHLSKISVSAGEKIKRGQRIGLVGHTGRATGPHLHWTVSLNDARIDPLLVLPADNTP
jgi:murein DD-endopeptidase MepM/ murein hydrolase activator NlpD